MDWREFRFDKVHWCAVAGHPANKFESEARTFAVEHPAVMEMFALECQSLIDENVHFSFKDVVARVRFTRGVKLSNSLSAPLRLLLIGLFTREEAPGLYYFQPTRRSIRGGWEDRHRLKRTAVGSLNEFSGKYGELLSNKDRDARAKLYYDQDLHAMFAQACRDAVKCYMDSGADWKVSVKDILQAARLNYKIKLRGRIRTEERVYSPLFSNTDVTYFARMMLLDVPELKRLVNGVKRIKHELDEEAMLVAPEAFLEI